MAKAYSFISKSFKYESVKKLKRKLRPIKWAVFGKEGIYHAIDLVKALEARAGRKEITTVFDIGAADGEYALTFAESFPRAKIYCFEPQTVSYAKLEKKTNSLGERIKLNKLGFYNSAAELVFNLNPKHPDASSLLPSEDSTVNSGRHETIRVERLDDFVKAHNVHHIDFMKIDVEGVEKEVIEGGMETLGKKVDNLFIEISFSRKGKYSANYIDVLRLLHTCGFALVEISENENFFLFEACVV